MEKINTIVLSGGGIKSAAYIGAFNCLFQKINKEQITHYIGTSAGAVFSVMLAIGYTCVELDKILMKYDFKHLIKDVDYDEFLCNYGVCKGENMCEFYTELLELKNIQKETTFIELYNKTNIKNTITITNFTTQSVEYWNHETTPNNSVLAAMLATSRVPIFFMPYKYNNVFYLDGGLIDNYPINIVPIDQLENVIGLCLTEKNNPDKIREICNSQDKIINYIIQIFLLKCNSAVTLMRNEYIKKTVYIEIEDIDFMDLEIDEQHKINMVNAGYHYTNLFIENNF